MNFRLSARRRSFGAEHVAHITPRQLEIPRNRLGFHDTVFSQHQDDAFWENTMATEGKPKIPLPKGWTGHVRSAVLNVIGLAQYATAYTRSWSANSPNAAQGRE